MVKKSVMTVEMILDACRHGGELGVDCSVGWGCNRVAGNSRASYPGARRGDCAIIEGVSEFERRIMDGEELRSRYAAGERNFAGVNLRDANISGSDPWNDNYRGADLSGINLSGADLSNSNLAGADLTDADLSNANLIRANLTLCNLTRTNLSGANLTEAFLQAVELIDTNMSGADLRRAAITQTQLGTANLTGAKNISTVDFEGTIVSNLTLEDGTVIEFCDHDW